MPSWRKVIVSGSDAVLSSVTASFLGNLTGTSSFAVTAATASTADNFYVRGSVGVGTVPNTSHQLDIASTKGDVNQSGIRVLFPAGGGLLNTEFGALAYRDGAWSAVYGKQGAASAAAYFDGNVGIGVTNPTQKLDVNGNANVGGGIIYLGQNTIDGSSDNLKISADSSNVSGNSSIEFLVDGTERARILNNGNVGIGQTSPSAYLDVKGGFDTAGIISLQLRSGNSSANFDSNQITLGYANSALYRHAIKTRHNSGAPSGNSIDFYTWKYGGADTDIGGEHVMSIDGTNVGIGSTAPSQKLDVNGAIRATLSIVNQANFAMYNSSTGLLTYLPTSSYTPVSASYAISSSFSTFAATANYANFAGTANTATEADNVFVSNTANDINYSLVLARPDHDEYEALEADNVNASYNPSTGTLTAVQLVETSALKFKENIVPLGSTLDQVVKLRGVSFTKKNTGEQQIGFIADEINEVYPQLVTKDKEGDVYGLSYQRMTAVLLESVKDLNAKIDAQNLFIMDLLKRIETLENK